MNWRSKLIHPQVSAPQGFRSLATPVYRGSTVVFTSQEDVSDGWSLDQPGYTYGLYGTPTTLELAARIAELEGAKHTFIVPSGAAAIAMVYFAFCKTGSHVLLPDNAYGPNKDLAHGMLRQLGVDVELYDPSLGARLGDRIRPETVLVWCESPGSITMEVQDVPAIVLAAHAKNVPVALDNTYSAGVLFDAFAAGVDVSMQALTKYVGGHSDLLLASVSTTSYDIYRKLGDVRRALGYAVSPDDCSLALRGLLTLGVRLEALERSTLTVANWLQDRPEIAAVLHPALPSCPGHEYWKRDFTGSASLFSVVFGESYTSAQVHTFVNALELFKIGWSWGGVNSLVMAYPSLQRGGMQVGGRIVRFNIGLEDPADLIDDLSAAMAALGS